MKCHHSAKKYMFECSGKWLFSLKPNLSIAFRGRQFLNKLHSYVFLVIFVNIFATYYCVKWKYFLCIQKKVTLSCYRSNVTAAAAAVGGNFQHFISFATSSHLDFFKFTLHMNATEAMKHSLKLSKTEKREKSARKEINRKPKNYTICYTRERKKERRQRNTERIIWMCTKLG